MTREKIALQSVNGKDANSKCNNKRTRTQATTTTAYNSNSNKSKYNSSTKS